MMKNLERKIALTRAVLFWERLWPALLTPLCLLGVFIILALAGVFELAPGWLHIGLLALLGAAFAWSLAPLVGVRVPGRDAALRRLDVASGAAHRPASTYFDTLETPPDDEQTLALWTLHKGRLRASLEALRPGLPSPNLPGRDPFALRAGVLVALVAALALSGSNRFERIRNAFDPGAAASAQTLRIDAWVTPPAYTGRPPVYLAGREGEAGVPGASAAGRESRQVPKNSELTVRLSGAGQARLLVKTPQDDKPVAIEALAAGQAGDDANMVREWRVTLGSDAAVVLKRRRRDAANWTFRVIGDGAPEISFAQAPGAGARNALTFSYRASDDYGVARADAEIRLAPQPGTSPARGAGLKIAPPDFALPLPGLAPRRVLQRVHRDLTAHPWAGLKVTMRLSARDQAGQTARSEPVTVTLPARQFTKPLARAVIEQRRKLIAAPGARLRIAMAIDALTMFPETYVKKSSVHLGLRTAFFQLTRAQSESDLLGVVDLLWDVALDIEDGDLSLAERELRAAQDALAKALAENASPDEIARLMKELRQALSRYMQALMRMEMQRRAQARDQDRGLDPNARQITPQDISRMMRRIEDLAKSGARDAARQMLSQLRDILENLRAGITAQRSQQQAATSKMLQELGGLIGKQQQLMDRTFRADRGMGGREGEESLKGEAGRNLSLQQEALRDLLQRMMEQMSKSGLKAPGALGRAGEAMDDAAGSLRKGAGRNAVDEQGRALDQLQQGAQALARQMLEGMARRTGRDGRGQTGMRNNSDPLGRPQKSSGPDFGLTTKVPDQIDVQRARQIMKLLRERLGDRTRPTIELDYLERLLRRF